MKCRMFPEGTNCFREYIAEKSGTLDILSTVIEYLEQITDKEFIEFLLLNILNK